MGAHPSLGCCFLVSYRGISYASFRFRTDTPHPTPFQGGIAAQQESTHKQRPYCLPAEGTISPSMTLIALVISSGINTILRFLVSIRVFSRACR